MASSSITKIGGVMIVTQVIPEEGRSIQLQAPDDASKPQGAQAPPSPPASPTKVNGMVGAYLRAEPHCLGVVQIIIGLLCILFSLSAAQSQLLMFHAYFCLAAFFVVSGSIAVAAWRRTSASMLWACLMSHSISILVSLGGVAFLGWLLSGVPPSREFCGGDGYSWYSSYRERTTCAEQMWLLDTTLYGLRGLFLVLLVLQACVAVTVCVFSGKAVRLRNIYVPIEEKDDDDVTLLGTNGGEKLSSAPNSP